MTNETRSPGHPRRGPLATLATAAAAVALAGVAPAAGQSTVTTAADDELRFTIVHTSDEHSALLPTPFVEYRPGAAGPARGGFARLAAAVGAVRAAKHDSGEPVLLTSAGDNLGGTPFAWLALEGLAPELGLMVEIGYDVVTLGNHEFDFGSERLAAYLAAAGYPAAGGRTALVATNTRPPPGHPLGERGILRTHLITLDNGLRIGFFGLIGRGAARFATFAPPVEFDDPQAGAAEAVADLRAAGAQVVVAITHAGLAEDRALARAVRGIDLILGGHDHRLLDEPAAEAGTLIAHPGAHLQQLLQLELAYRPADGSLRLRNAETGTPYVLALDHTVGEDAVIAARVAAYRERAERRIAELSAGAITSLAQRVARSRFALAAEPPLTETAIGNFVTDAIRAAAERATGEPVDFAFQANGVIRAGIEPGGSEWNRHAISAYDVLRAVGIGFGPDSLPGYPLVSVWLTGDEVRNALEVSVLLSGLLGNSYYLQPSGLRMRYDPRRAVWARIPFRGTPVPSGRAVLGAERLAGDALVPLARGDTTLYHVVADRYVVSFLPMVGRVAPRFAIVPKDRDGRPLADLDDGIVRVDGRELKTWQAVAAHLAAQPRDADGAPWIDPRYGAPEGRLVAARGAPLWSWPALALALAAGLAATWRRRARAAGTHQRRARAT